MLLRFLLALLFKIPDWSIIKSCGGFYSQLIHRTSFLLALIIQYILKNESHQCSHMLTLYRCEVPSRMILPVINIDKRFHRGNSHIICKNDITQQYGIPDCAHAKIPEVSRIDKF